MMNGVNKIAVIESLIKSFQLNLSEKQKVKKDRNEIKNILSGKDSRLLLVIGPCSAWPLESVLVYAKKVKSLQKQMEKKIKIVMRIYVQKSRTKIGWSGPFFQPDPFKPSNIKKGILYTRKLMKRVVQTGVPIASEIVFPHTAKFFEEYLSLGVIGARSSENPEHRLFASGADYPIGLKNGRDGNLQNAINGVYVAQQSGFLFLNNQECKTKGNVFTPLIMRGSVSKPNYDLSSVKESIKLLKKNSIINPALLIDVSHDNSVVNGRKNYKYQIDVVKDILANRKKYQEFEKYLKGIMLESFLKSGKRDLKNISQQAVDYSGLSITDPCLGWEETEKMINDIFCEI